MYIANVNPRMALLNNPHLDQLVTEHAKQRKQPEVVAVCAADVEADIAELDAEEDKLSLSSNDMGQVRRAGARTALIHCGLLNC